MSWFGGASEVISDVNGRGKRTEVNQEMIGINWLARASLTESSKRRSGED